MTTENLQTLLDKSTEERNYGNYDEADKLAIEVLDELDKPSNTSDVNISVELLRANALISLGSTARRRGKYDTALEHLHKVLILAAEYSLPALLPKVHNLVGLIYMNLGRYDKSIEHYRQGLSASEELGFKSPVAVVMCNIGSVYMHQGNYAKSLEYFIQAISLYEELGDKSGIAYVWGNIGGVHMRLGNYAKSLEYISLALSAHEEMGNKPLIAQVTGNIGLVYMKLGNDAKSLEYYLRALSGYVELGEQSGIAGVTGNIGTVYMNLGDYAKSLEYFMQALSTLEELGEKSSIADVKSNIGGGYMYLGNYAKCLEYYRQALSAYEEIREESGIAYMTGNIGGVYANQAFEGYDAELAEMYLLKAIAMNEKIGAKEHQYNFHKSLSDLYKTEKRWQECQAHFERYHDIKEEVQSEETKKQAEQMEYRRKIEESERDRQVKLARFQEQEKILHNILPSQIADRMIDGEKTIADNHEHVSVFFSDIVGFTKLSQRVTAQELVGMLNGIFTQFDQLARKHGLEKIKTIGDAYMAVAGAPTAQENHAERSALFALDVTELMKNYHTDMGEKIDVRIGLHTGSAVAGIIGENKFSYDLWGDAVNTASRMESQGEAGKIHVSEEFKHAVESLHATSLQFIRRGELDIKGKGRMTTYFLEKNINN